MPLTLTSGFSAKSGADIRRLFAEAKKIYAPGGGYATGIEAGLKRGRTKAVATGMQNLASAGLAGTSMAGGLGLKYEEDVAVPARERMETQRLGALSGLLQAEAGAELQMAPRYGYTAPQQQQRQPQSRVSIPQRQTTRRPSTTRQPEARRPQSLLNKGPQQLFKKSASGTGYKGVYFGKAFYDKRKKTMASFADSFKAASTPSSSSLMQQADVYDLSGRYF